MAHFLAAIPKALADSIRNLPGRFDGHTIEAVRLFFCEECDSADEFSQQFDLAQRGEGTLLGNFGALRSFGSRMIGYLP
ncbi:MAG: hypothetical protein FJ118_06015 [Deltaproteobacteria bacterium]|nr:hypothetical protein [Deltaproteobacteria bacterium]